MQSDERQPIGRRTYDILTGAYNRSRDDAVPLKTKITFVVESLGILSSD